MAFEQIAGRGEASVGAGVSSPLPHKLQAGAEPAWGAGGAQAPLPPRTPLEAKRKEENRRERRKKREEEE